MAAVAGNRPSVCGAMMRSGRSSGGAMFDEKGERREDALEARVARGRWAALGF